MPDPSSSGPLGSGGDEREIEAVARDLYANGIASTVQYAAIVAEKAIAALDRVRGVRDDNEDPQEMRERLNHEHRARWAARSPQGEDHEAGIEAAMTEMRLGSGTVRERTERVVAAYLSHSSPDALLVRQRDDWKHRAEMLQAEAERWREMAQNESERRP